MEPNKTYKHHVFLERIVKIAHPENEGETVDVIVQAWVLQTIKTDEKSHYTGQMPLKLTELTVRPVGAEDAAQNIAGDPFMFSMPCPVGCATYVFKLDLAFESRELNYTIAGNPEINPLDPVMTRCEISCVKGYGYDVTWQGELVLSEVHSAKEAPAPVEPSKGVTTQA